MAQSIDLALKDVFEQLKQLAWLDVANEAGKTAGKRKYSLEITPGPIDEESTFSSHYKVNYGYTLTLKVNREANTALIPENARAISRVLLEDRRRAQNAQTTILDSWAVVNDEGRENVEMTNTMTIRILDTGEC